MSRSGSVQVKALVPVRAQGPLGDGGSLRLLAIDGSNSEGVRKACDLLVTAALKLRTSEEGGERTEDIALVETIRGDDYRQGESTSVNGGSLVHLVVHVGSGSGYAKGRNLLVTRRLG